MLKLPLQYPQNSTQLAHVPRLTESLHLQFEFFNPHQNDKEVLVGQGLKVRDLKVVDGECFFSVYLQIGLNG